MFFLLHSPSGFPAWALPSTLPFGVRTFLATTRAARLPGLQAQHIAALRSHDVSVTRPHPTLRGGYRVRFAALVGALFLYGWGELLTVRANVGLGPWDVLHQAVSIHTGLRFGVATVIVSFVVLVLAAVLGERPGIGTAAQCADRRLGLRPLRSHSALAPHLNGGVAGLALDVFGILVIGLASALYIGASFGAGPRDSLMLALVRRGPRISVASWAIQIGALTIGWAFGGSVGIGTVLFALGLGPCIEGAYWVLCVSASRDRRRKHRAAAAARDRGYVRAAGTSAPPASSAAVSDNSLRRRSSRASQNFIANAPTVTLSRVPHSGHRRCATRRPSASSQMRSSCKSLESHSRHRISGSMV